MERELACMDVSVQYTPSGNYYSTECMCSVNKLPVAEQEAIKKVLGKEHKTALVQ